MTSESGATSGEAAMADLQPNELEAVEQLRKGYDQIRSELAKVIVGQTQVIEELLVAVFCRAHCLLVGVPGLAKTLMVSTLSQTLNMTFNRIQFTPDLMPSDITGTEVIEEDRTTGRREMVFMKGPIFANIILADEINRTPPKTQAALLEAMQERQVTSGGVRRPVPDPFFVLATQNPIEQEGTYPLPEAQLDRFMFMVMVDYPEVDEEFDIVRLTTTRDMPEVDAILTGEQIITLQHVVRNVAVADHVIRYAIQISRLTRRQKGGVPDFITDYVTWGAGPRASQYMIMGAKARALLHGRYHATCDDVLAVAKPVLRHRVITNFNAEAEGVQPDDIVDRLAQIIPRDPSEAAHSGRLPEVFRSEDASQD